MTADARLAIALAYADEALAPLGDFAKRDVMRNKIARAWLEGFAAGLARLVDVEFRLDKLEERNDLHMAKQQAAAGYKTTNADGSVQSITRHMQDCRDPDCTGCRP